MLHHGLPDFEVRAVNVFLFKLVQANIRSVLELGWISVAGMVLILQYVVGVWCSAFCGDRFSRQVPGHGEFISNYHRTTNSDCDKDVAIGLGIVAHRTDCIRPVGFFSPSPNGCILHGKGNT
jgi:hypothetical protein